MANVTCTSQLLSRGNISSTVYCPTPIRRIAPSSRLALFKTISAPDISQYEIAIGRQRAVKSLDGKLHCCVLRDYNSETSDSSIDQKHEIEKLESPDLVEDVEYFEQIVPPARAGNPLIYDEEFLKINNGRTKRSLGNVERRRNQIQSAFGIQEP